MGLPARPPPQQHLQACPHCQVCLACLACLACPAFLACLVCPVQDLLWILHSSLRCSPKHKVVCQAFAHLCEDRCSSLDSVASAWEQESVLTPYISGMEH